ncbi:MAG: DUF3823 domain-containing protein [Dysgonamonadaceae bacterium]|jgi:hypothetical protein|nr:DUF3823 domain-containing protein [Dysgonamonadaceae bacterium]
MRTIKQLIWIALLVGSITACVEIDNYDEPQETLCGKIVDKKTGNPFQTQTGSDGIRIKLLEYSWSDNPTPYYFNCMQDGSFNNTKIFKGNYNIEPLGAFVPLLIKDAGGEVVKDETKTVDISGVTNLTFEVEPFLNVEWVDNPAKNADGTVTIRVKVTRGTDHPDYQKNLTDIYLFVSNNSYVGNNNYISNYSTKVTYSGAAGNDVLGTTVSITTKALPSDRVFYLRVGARIDVMTDGIQRYNYSTIQSVDLR